VDRVELMLGSREFFAEIKEFVPGQCRRYDENARVWTVDEKFLPLVIQKLEYHFPPIQVVLSEVGTLSRFFVSNKKRARHAMPLRKRMVA